MKKYRIIKKETIIEGISPSIKDCYIIQQKFLWFWYNKKIENAVSMRYALGLATTYSIYEFYSLERAEYVLNKFIKNKFTENYRGNKIYFIYTEQGGIYINKSNIIGSHLGVFAYECNLYIDRLKQNIDIRKAITKKIVIK